jgi:hypothetical protein
MKLSMDRECIRFLGGPPPKLETSKIFSKFCRVVAHLKIATDKVHQTDRTKSKHSISFINITMGVSDSCDNNNGGDGGSS